MNWSFPLCRGLVARRVLDPRFFVVEALLGTRSEQLVMALADFVELNCLGNRLGTNCVRVVK